MNPELVENQIVGHRDQGPAARSRGGHVQQEPGHEPRLGHLPDPALQGLAERDERPRPADRTSRRCGAGEPPICPVRRAIANAFFDATGVRIREAR